MLAINHIYQIEATALIDQLANDSVDALITDPPYSSGGALTAARKRDPKVKYQNSEIRDKYPTFSGDFRDQRSQEKWLIHWLTKAWPKLKDGAIVGLFTDWRQYPLTAEAMQIAGYTWLGVVVWDKTEACRPQMDRFRNQSEYCLIARKLTFKPVINPPKFFIWGAKGLLNNNRGVGVLPGVFRHYLQPVDKKHMTAKPLPLMREIVKIANPGGLIVDPFAGSGTTLAAAKAEGYQYIGGELLAEHVATAKEQIAAIQPFNSLQNLPLFNNEEYAMPKKYYSQAKQLVIDTQKAGYVHLQRNLKISFYTAVNLMDDLIKEGVIADYQPNVGFKVLIKKED